MSTYLQRLPLMFEDTVQVLKIPRHILIGGVELLASQIIGMFLYVININLSVIFNFPLPITYQLVFNYIFFKFLQFAISKFQIVPLPKYKDNNHQLFGRTFLLPSAGMMLIFYGIFISAFLMDQYSIGFISLNTSSFYYSLLANTCFVVFVDQLARTGKAGKLQIIHLVFTLLFCTATFLTLTKFYLTL